MRTSTSVSEGTALQLKRRTLSHEWWKDDKCFLLRHQLEWRCCEVRAEQEGKAQFTDSPTFQLWDKWLKWVSGLIFGDGEARHLGNCQSSMSSHWKALIRLVRCPSVGTLYYTRPIKFSLATSRSKITVAADIFIDFICWYFSGYVLTQPNCKDMPVLFKDF